MEVWGRVPGSAPRRRWAMRPTRRLAAWMTASLTALAIGVALPAPAAADPSTPATYPAASSATRLAGYFFDTCTAPSLTALAAWKGRSPYAGVNIYFGGRNRGCTQPNLTSTWVRSTRTSWSLPVMSNSSRPAKPSRSLTMPTWQRS